MFPQRVSRADAPNRTACGGGQCRDVGTGRHDDNVDRGTVPPQLRCEAGSRQGLDESDGVVLTLAYDRGPRLGELAVATSVSDE